MGRLGLHCQHCTCWFFNNRWTLPNFPCIFVQPPPLFWMILSFAVSLYWVVLMMLLKWLHRQLWSTLVIHNVLLCWISYWDQGLADKYCLGLAIKRISREEGWRRRCLSMEFPLHPVPWGNRRVSEWQLVPLHSCGKGLWHPHTCYERSGITSSEPQVCEWHLELMDLLKSRPNGCLCTFFWGQVIASAQLRVHWMASSQL